MRLPAGSSSKLGSFAVVKSITFSYNRHLPLFISLVAGLVFIPSCIQLLHRLFSATTPALASLSFNSSTGAPLVDLRYTPYSATQAFADQQLEGIRIEFTFKGNQTDHQNQSPIHGPNHISITPVTLTKSIGRLKVKVIPYVNISELLIVEETGWAFKRPSWKGCVKVEVMGESLGRVRGWFELNQLSASDFFNGDGIIYKTSSELFTARLSEIRMKELSREEHGGTCEGVVIMPSRKGDSEHKAFSFFYGCAS